MGEHSVKDTILEIFQRIISNYRFRLLPLNASEYVRLRGNGFYLEIYAHLDEAGVIYYWTNNGGEKKQCNISNFIYVRGNVDIQNEYYMPGKTYGDRHKYFLSKLVEGLERQPDILNGDREWLDQYKVFGDCEITKDAEAETWEQN